MTPATLKVRRSDGVFGRHNRFGKRPGSLWDIITSFWTLRGSESPTLVNLVLRVGEVVNEDLEPHPHVPSSLAAQRDHGIDFCGPPRRKQRRQQANCCKAENNRGVSFRVTRIDIEE